MSTPIGDRDPSYEIPEFLTHPIIADTGVVLKATVRFAVGSRMEPHFTDRTITDPTIPNRVTRGIAVQRPDAIDLTLRNHMDLYPIDGTDGGIRRVIDFGTMPLKGAGMIEPRLPSRDPVEAATFIRDTLDNTLTHENERQQHSLLHAIANAQRKRYGSGFLHGILTGGAGAGAVLLFAEQHIPYGSALAGVSFLSLLIGYGFSRPISEQQFDNADYGTSNELVSRDFGPMLNELTETAFNMGRLRLLEGAVIRVQDEPQQPQE